LRVRRVGRTLGEPLTTGTAGGKAHGTFAGAERRRYPTRIMDGDAGTKGVC
jgi:hypothetical protein